MTYKQGSRRPKPGAGERLLLVHPEKGLCEWSAENKGECVQDMPGEAGGPRPCRASSVHACALSHVSWLRFFVTLWTIARQAPLSIGFSRQEHWSGLPCPPPGDLPNSGIKPTSPALQADSLPLSHRKSPQGISGQANYCSPHPESTGKSLDGSNLGRD